MSGEVAVEVVYALPHEQRRVSLELPAGATVADALRAVAGRPGFADLDLQHVPVGVFGDRVERDYRLRAGDRVEIYRPLQIDPREARRQRAGRQSGRQERAPGAGARSGRQGGR